MALPTGVESTQELLAAQSHIWNHIFNHINSLSLKCAIQLGIPDAIHKHGEPMTLSQLADALPVAASKSDGLRRLMRILTHSKFFVKVKICKDKDEDEDGEEEAYSLTTASRLLVRGEPLSIGPFALAMLDATAVDPFQHMGEWFWNEEVPTPFFSAHGKNFFEHAGEEQGWNRLFNEGMASDARLVATVLGKDCREVFEGLRTMVDVGGGTGTMARAVADAFPGMKCTVLELPHVVAGLEGAENLSFVGGDMFESIPHVDAVFLKWIYHDWSDKESIKLLRKCKDAVKNNGGKVIIVDMVVADKKRDYEAIQTQLCFDMLMMTVTTGKERTEKEWATLFLAAGFTSYKITPVLGLRSLIEWIYHDWNDEECIKLLQKCKEAVKNNGGKVIIVDMVVDDKKRDYEATQTQLCFDMLMMTVTTGKERTEKEWATLFLAAGFTSYKITPVLGLRSLIEVFP